jgi:hypothetical protein
MTDSLLRRSSRAMVLWIRWEVNMVHPMGQWRLERDRRCPELVMSVGARKLDATRLVRVRMSSVQTVSVLEQTVSSLDCQ